MGDRRRPFARVLVSMAGALALVSLAGLAPAGALGNPTLDRLILNVPVAGWSRTTGPQRLTTAQADSLYYATEDFSQPNGPGILLITLLDESSYPFPKANDLAGVACGGSPRILVDTTDPALPGSLVLTCTSPTVTTATSIVWRQNGILSEVRLNPASSLPPGQLRSVALRQSQAITTGKRPNTDESPGRQPLVIGGLALIAVLFVVLVVLLRRDRRRGRVVGYPPAPTEARPEPAPPVAAAVAATAPAPPVPDMPGEPVVAPMPAIASPVPASGSALPPFGGPRPDGPPALPADQVYPFNLARPNSSPAAPLDAGAELPSFEAIRQAGRSSPLAPEPSPPAAAPAPGAAAVNGTVAPVGPPPASSAPAVAAPAVPTSTGGRAPGWHADPQDAARVSYWDGARWTHTKRWDGSVWVDAR